MLASFQPMFSAHMPYHITWNLDNESRFVWQGFAGYGREWEYSIHDSFSALALNRVRTRITHSHFEGVAQIKGSTISKQKHYQNHQPCELLSMNHENQSGEKQEECPFISLILPSSIWAETIKSSGLISFALTEFVTLCLWKSSLNKAPAFLFPPHQSPKPRYEFHYIQLCQ